MARRNIVVIGGSAGAADVVSGLLSGLPPSPAACICVSLHMEPSRDEWLRDWLARHTALPAISPRDKEPLREGALYVARPDFHLIVKEGYLLSSRGPRENLWRPAIDVLFRTAAVAYRSRVVGLLLSGELDDGTAGLQAIKACGGLSLVQEPDDARHPTMPRTAAANVAVDRYVSAADMSRVLAQIIMEEAPPAAPVPAELAREALIAEGETSYADERPGAPSPLSCPECGGPLWQRGSDAMQFRCMVGHAYHMDSLARGTDESLHRTLWAAIRLFEQRANLSRMMSQQELTKGREVRAKFYVQRATESHEYARQLRRLQQQHERLLAESGTEESGRPEEPGQRQQRPARTKP